jgi:hypothetical protein
MSSTPRTEAWMKEQGIPERTPILDFVFQLEEELNAAKPKALPRDPVQAYAALHEQWKQENKGTFEWWLFTKLAELEQWKKEAMEVMPDYQEIGRLLNIPTGTAVHTQLIPRTKAFVDLVQKIADWSRRYPRGRTYSMSNRKMDDELIQLEAEAVQLLP